VTARMMIWGPCAAEVRSKLPALIPDCLLSSPAGRTVTERLRNQRASQGPQPDAYSDPRRDDGVVLRNLAQSSG
jgi:hypothetical protein